MAYPNVLWPAYRNYRIRLHVLFSWSVGCDSATPLLKKLHWLPVNKRVDFKICLHIFKAHILKYPVNICERLQQHQPSRMLRSSSRNLLTEHRTSTSAGDRAFSNAGPALWNSLPDSCRKASSVDSFKKLLKTHLFCLWFWLLICVGHIQALCNLWKRRYINASLLFYYYYYLLHRFVTGNPLLFAYPEDHVDNWLVILFLYQGKHFMLSIFVFLSSAVWNLGQEC